MMMTKSMVVLGLSYDADEELLLYVSSEKIYKQTLEIWKEQQQKQQQQQDSSMSSSSSWDIWKRFAKQLSNQYEIFILNDNEMSGFQISVTDIVGAMEEGILTIERLEQQSGARSSKDDNEDRDSALAVLYTEYGRLLLYSSSLHPSSSSSSDDNKNRNVNALSSPSHRCFALANDPHTLLIGAPERIKEYNNEMKKLSLKLDDNGDNDTNDDDNSNSKLIISLFGSLCIDNAENAIRNAISLDATNKEAELLLTKITGLSSEESVHKRKPKEFVAELFDSFADTFDTKLLETLKYKAPKIIGNTVKDIIVTGWGGVGYVGGDSDSESDSNNKHPYSFHNVLDAGCGTGLAGRELRNAIDNINNNNIDQDQNQNQNQMKRITLVGVDASSKMLQIANKCTLNIGCGSNSNNDELLPTKTKNDNNSSHIKLYDQLLEMDLEDMTIQNTLLSSLSPSLSPSTTTETETETETDFGFDLIVAADVFVYFGSLDKIMNVLSKLHHYYGADDEYFNWNREGGGGGGDGGGILIFTCEYATIDEAPLGYRLLSTGRFAHTKDYVISSALQNGGYILKHYQKIIPREEKGIPVQGHIFVFEYSPDFDKNKNNNNNAEL